jgi:2-C-methyl-D-erythritol 2,4-cyclodiphosphate synthase
MILLAETLTIVTKYGWVPVYIDATIIAQTPTLSPYVLKMKNNLSNCLGILPENVNIKSTTTDGLGFLGNSEGIATLAIATMENII